MDLPITWEKITFHIVHSLSLPLSGNIVEWMSRIAHPGVLTCSGNLPPGLACSSVPNPFEIDRSSAGPVSSSDCWCMTRSRDLSFGSWWRCLPAAAAPILFAGPGSAAPGTAPESTKPHYPLIETWLPMATECQGCHTARPIPREERTSIPVFLVMTNRKNRRWLS